MADADYTDPTAPDPKPRPRADYPLDPNDATQPAPYDPNEVRPRPDYALLHEQQKAEDKRNEERTAKRQREHEARAKKADKAEDGDQDKPERKPESRTETRTEAKPAPVTATKPVRATNQH